MSAWLRYFNFFRRDPRADAGEEVGFHIEMRTRDYLARGMTLDEARRAAEKDFGSPGSPRRVVEEVTRIDTRAEERRARAEWWDALVRDVRVGLRSLRRSPAFTITAVLTAGLGIGVTAAIVSAGYAILVRPLPFFQPDRLVAIYSENPGRGWTRVNISWPDYVSWREGSRAFEDIGMWTWNSFTLADQDSVAQRIEGARVTANLFRLLGVQPAIGRHFASDEDGAQRAQVVLLGDGLWRSRFGADSGIVGRTVLLDGRAYSVVGVMPPGFNFPDRGDLWIPFQVNPAEEVRGNRGYAGAIGRLKAGVTLEQGRADLHRIDAVLAREFPDENRYWRADVNSLRDILVGDLQQPLKVFLWSVALVLLLVCANVANLMLARGAVRSRELAVRSALGASRGRLSRQLMTENMLVAGLGGAIGVGVAWWGVRLLRFAFPDQLPPYFITLALDSTALLILVGITLLTGLLFGVLPAVRVTRLDLNASIRDGDRAGASMRSSRLRGVLVMAEVALSVVLMIGALLLLRSYRNLQATDLGFDEHGILSARITLPRVTYPTLAHSSEFYDRLDEKLRGIPGVTAVGHAQGIPFSGWNVAGGAQVEGAPVLPENERLDTHNQLVSPDFFRAMGVQLVRGRWLTPQDRDTLAPVVLVNERMVQVGFGGKDPVGRRIEVNGWPIATVVGVIRDYRHYRLPQPMGPATYFAWPAWPTRGQTMVIRTSVDDPASLVPQVQAAVRSIDPLVPLSDVQTFEDVVSRSLWRQRLQGNVLAIFAALSLVLACVGLYGVVSYAVAQRTREIGVRMALGATRRRVVLIVFGQSGRVVFAGVAIGLVAALFAVRVMAALLYGVEARDLTTFFFAPVVLTLAATLATLAPALRATRV
ncbi:MAG TPA: ABC transporter permease, partial [Gemmatimonadaceae bacterium]|nr:ABC transporter permease [Gemmatimonadaceae bacterium]